MSRSSNDEPLTTVENNIEEEAAANPRGVASIYLAKHEVRGVLVGGAVAAVVLFATTVGVGRVGSFEALRLIEAALPTARFLAAAVVGSSVTVLALLLTLVGLSLGSEYRFGETLYARANLLTRLSVFSIVIGTAVLLAVTVPIGEVAELATYYDVLYYTLMSSLSVLGGLVVATGLLIGLTLRSLIAIGHPHGKSDLLDDEDDADSSPEPAWSV